MMIHMYILFGIQSLFVLGFIGTPIYIFLRLIGVKGSLFGDTLKLKVLTWLALILWVVIYVNGSVIMMKEGIY